ncbi:hypothetical protein MKK84_03660 [Methylobacterium sp. E-065]|uniref:hypothetical protein n=1 Tax=Methylobacterium sp. E-065 TaxID=2836583 RepID=UPI001FBB6F63|nr:hypothetical protein [Methylobacterium sp. E-065]MCJ2016528.1 hypothetical protein [Methylobacterium sp. E-065]
MFIAGPLHCVFEREIAALMARMQSCDTRRDRYDDFDALVDLEDRARGGGASPLTLRKIAEVRFLVGILREAVRPVPVASLRTVLWIRGLGNSLRRSGAAPDQPHAAAESAA